MFRSFFDPMPRVVAHRGDSAHFPENTLPAFESACRMGVDVIETDVHLSRDGHLVGNPYLGRSERLIKNVTISVFSNESR